MKKLQQRVLWGLVAVLAVTPLGAVRADDFSDPGDDPMGRKAAPEEVADQSKVRTEPADGAVLDQPLRSVRLWLSEAHDPARLDLRLTGPAGDLPLRGLHAMEDNGLMAFVSGTMPDGEYVLSWSQPGSEGRSRSSFHIARQKDSAAIGDYEAPLDIGVLVFDGVEPLDLFGPLEMWMNAGPDLIRVHLIAETAGPVVVRTVSYPADLAPRLDVPYSFESAPPLDVLMVPGGIGTLREVDNRKLIEFVAARAPEVQVMASVCTGAAILAKAGLLDGQRATANKAFFSYIKGYGGDTEWIEEARWVESGRVMTSSGVSAGIDMSLALMARFFGIEGARMVAAMAEYDWNEDPSRDPFTSNLDLATPSVPALKAALREEVRGDAPGGP
ncbi:MAG: DJ-1/PfpI family protein [Acidobacteriota bacterium]